MRFAKKMIVPLFAFTALTGYENISFAQGGSKKPDVHIRHQKETPTEEATKKRVFKDLIVKEFIANPRFYDVTKKALASKEMAESVLWELSADKYSKDGKRLIQHFPGVVSFTGELGSIFSDHSKHSTLVSSRYEMRKNTDHVLAVAEQLTNELYDVENGSPSIKRFYRKLHEFEGGENLPDPVDLKGLALEHQDLIDRYNKPQFNDKQKRLFCEGKMSVDEYKKVLGISDSDYLDHLKQSYRLVLPGPEVIPASLASQPVASALSQQQIQEENEKRYNKFNDELTKGYTAYSTGTALISLFDKKAAALLSKAGDASFAIADHVGRMAINRALDPTGLAGVATGLGIIIDLFGGGPSADQITIDLLHEVLKGQRTTLERIDELDAKLQKNEAHLINLTRLADSNFQIQLQELQKIGNTLNEVKTILEDNKDFERSLAQESIILQYQARKEALIDIFNNPVNGDLYVQINSALNNPKATTQGAQAHFATMANLLSEMAVTANVQLQDRKINTYSDHSAIAALNLEQLIQKQTLTISKRTGMLPGIGEWLTAHADIVDYDEHYKGNHSTAGVLDIDVGNPAIFSQLFKDYIELSLYRPDRMKDGSNVGRDTNIDAFCNNLNQFDDMVENARAQLPVAIAVTNFYLKKMSEEHRRHIAQEGHNQRLVDAKNRVLLGGQDVQEIQAYISGLNDEEFTNLGKWIGFFDKKRRIMHVPGTYYGSVTTIGYSMEANHTNYSLPLFSYRWCLVDGRNASFAPTKEDFIEGLQAGGKYYTNFETSEILGTAPSTDDNVRQAYKTSLASEITRRHKLIEQAWQRKLDDQSKPILTNLYKAKFVVETLAEIGYGPTYKYAASLNDLNKTMAELNSAMQIVEGWRNGVGVIDEKFTPNELKDPVERNDFVIQFLGPESVFTPSWGWDENGLLKVEGNQFPEKPDHALEQYLENSCFLLTVDVNGNDNVLKSYPPTYPIPIEISDPFVLDIGNIEVVRDVLKFMEQNVPRLAPMKNCLEMPKP